ncbi:MAG: DUF2752 domain-containing protein [Erysipelotrichaceae bacterium]
MSKKLIIKHLLVIVSLLVYVFAVWYFQIYCPIRFVFGIPCPTCGMTRATISFLRCDITSALNYHGLFFLILPLLLLYPHFSLFIKDKKKINFITIIIAIVIFSYYIYRLFYHLIP